MIKKLMLSFCFLLSQVLTVNAVQAQEYPGFKSWNEHIREILQCDSDNSKVCLPFAKPTPSIYWTQFYCSSNICLRSSDKTIYASTMEELNQIMQANVIEFNKQYPELGLQVTYPHDNVIMGSISYMHEGNRFYNVWGVTSMSVSCDYAEGLGCINQNLDRTTMSDAPCDICSKVGNPFDVRNGAKYEHATDITFPIVVSRNYSSRPRVPGLLGKNWRTNFDKTVRVIKNNNIITALLFTN